MIHTQEFDLQVVQSVFCVIETCCGKENHKQKQSTLRLIFTDFLDCVFFNITVIFVVVLFSPYLAPNVYLAHISTASKKTKNKNVPKLNE